MYARFADVVVFVFQSLLHGFPDYCPKLNSLKSSLISSLPNENWSKEWDSVLKPLLRL